MTGATAGERWRGCLVGNTTAEFVPGDPEAEALVAAAYDGFVEVVAAALRRGAARVKAIQRGPVHILQRDVPGLVADGVGVDLAGAEPADDAVAAGWAEGQRPVPGGVVG